MKQQNLIQDKKLDTENELKQWLREEIGLGPGREENLQTTKMEVHSLAELKEKSGIETSNFSGNSKLNGVLVLIPN